MGVCAGFLMRSPDAAQHHKGVHARLSTRYGGALLIRGPHLASLGPGSAAQRTGHETCFTRIRAHYLTDNSTRDFAFSRRDAPEGCMNFPPLREEGVGNAGRPMHPQPRVRMG